MGNQPPSLTRRLRYNDRTLTELELVNHPSELGVENHLLDEFFRALKHNQTVTSLVITNAFSDALIGPTWRDFLEALVGLKKLEQLELLETDIPFYSLPRIVSATKALKAIGIHQSILSGMKVKDIEILSNSLVDATTLEEFVWEQNFETLGRENGSSALDPLLFALAKLPNLQIVTISACPTSLVPLFSPMALESFCHQFSDTLVTLDLSGCGLRAFHFEVLLTTLAVKKSLQTLHVQRNNNEAHDLTPLLQLVEENYYLQDVASDATGLIKKQLDFWLVLNQTIRPRLLSTSPSGRFRVWCSLIADTKHDPTVLFYLLNEYQDYWIRGPGMA
jgi:hypothetical protein